MESTRDVGVVIVNYRTADLIERALRDWSAEAHPASRVGTVVVIDNDPGQLDAAIERQGLPVRYVRASGNWGFAYGVNSAWQSLDQPYVLLLSADARISLASIATLAAFLDREPSVGAVAPLHLDHHGRPTNPYRRLPGWLDLLAGRTHLFRFQWAKRRAGRYLCEDLGTPDTTQAPFEVEQPPASCLMLRARAVSKPPMDERFPILFNDVDLSMRLAADHWRTVVVPQVVCRHEPSGSTRYLGNRATGELYVAAYRYIRKWQGPLRAQMLRLALIGESILDLRNSGGARSTEARITIKALLSNQSLFDARDESDPVRRYWPDEHPA